MIIHVFFDFDSILASCWGRCTPTLPLDMLCESLTATFWQPLESILRFWFSVFLWRARYFKGRNFYTEPCLKVAISLLWVRWWILICVMNIWGPAWREVLVGRATRAVVLVCEKRIYPKSCRVWPGFRSDWPEICGFHSFNIWAELDMIWPWLFNTLQLAAFFNVMSYLPYLPVIPWLLPLRSY